MAAIETEQVIAKHYRLVEPIGSGAMGVVWRAFDLRLQRTVAIKQILLAPGLSEADRDIARRRAMREAQIAARLQHPNAIVVFDVAEHDDNPCLVMEYLPSRSLAEEIAERGSLPPREVAAIGKQVAAALQAAHRVGIVHRDIKPANVLIDASGTAKITDFGISRAVGDVTLTQTGLLTGTPAYLAPELARGADPTPSSDLFSLGATLYHAVEGQTVFGEQQNQLAQLYAAAHGEVVPPRQAGPLAPLLGELLRGDPAQRPDIEQVGHHLAAVASGVITEAPATVPAAPAPRADGTVPAGPAPAPVAAAAVPARPNPAPTRIGAAPQAVAVPDGRTRRRVITGIATAVAVAVGITVAILVPHSSREPGDGRSANAPVPTTSSASPAPTSQLPGLGHTPNSGGQIEYTPAGQLVINYYTFPDGAAASWPMLTPAAQAVFGGRSEFREYWNQFTYVSAANARGVTSNPDGSVNVPVDVTYHTDTGDHPDHTVLRVVRTNGKLLIDSDTRLDNAQH